MKKIKIHILWTNDSTWHLDRENNHWYVQKCVCKNIHQRVLCITAKMHYSKNLCSLLNIHHQKIDIILRICLCVYYVIFKTRVAQFYCFGKCFNTINENNLVIRQSYRFLPPNFYLSWNTHNKVLILTTFKCKLQ